MEFNEFMAVKFFGDITVGQGLKAILLLVICLMAIKLIMRGTNRALKKTPIEKNLHGFIRSGTKILLYLLMVIIVGDSIGIKMTSLVALMSVAGLAISLSIQGALSNLASGILILITKPFVVDDHIEAGGVSGIVNQIGLIYTRITTFDNTMIFVPNSEISSEKIINYMSQKIRRVDIKLSLSYDTKLEDVRTLVFGMIQEIPEAIVEPAPQILVSEYESSAVKYVIRVWTNTEDYWTVYLDLNEKIKLAVEQNKLHIPYPSLNVRMMEK